MPLCVARYTGSVGIHKSQPHPCRQAATVVRPAPTTAIATARAVQLAGPTRSRITRREFTSRADAILVRLEDPTPGRYDHADLQRQLAGPLNVLAYLDQLATDLTTAALLGLLDHDADSAVTSASDPTSGAPPGRDRAPSPPRVALATRSASRREAGHGAGTSRRCAGSTVIS